MCDDPFPRSLRRGCPRSPHRTYFQPDLHIEKKIELSMFYGLMAIALCT